MIAIWDILNCSTVSGKISLSNTNLSIDTFINIVMFYLLLTNVNWPMWQFERALDFSGSKRRSKWCVGYFDTMNTSGRFHLKKDDFNIKTKALIFDECGWTDTKQTDLL